MSFRPISEAAADLVRQAERDRKLKLIATLDLGEIEGWRVQLRLGNRPAYEGEAAALTARERELEGAR